MSKGEPYKRCGCTEIVDGKRRQLGQQCPKLRRKDGTWNPRHGTWAVNATVQGRGGVREPVRRAGFESQAAAQQFLESVKEKARRGVAISTPTVGVYLAEWMAAKTDISPSTVRSYAGQIKNYHVPAVGHLRLDEMRVAHVAEMLAEVPGSDATRQRVRASLRAALNDAIREGLILVNPAALVKLPSGKRPKALVWTAERVERWRAAQERLDESDPGAPEREQLELAAQAPSPVMVWTPSQLGEFLDAAEADRLYSLWHLIAHRGLRRGEAAGVEWSDIDLAAGTLTVRRQLVQVGWAVIERQPKSDAGNRTIALDAGTVAALREHRKRQMAERMEWASAWTETGKAFTRENGETLHPATVTDRFHDIVTAAGLPPIRLHDLRHGAASLMLAAGVAMKTVQETLGHSSSTLTADTYTSVYPTVAAEAAEAAAAMVPRTGTGTGVHTISTHPETARPGVGRNSRSSGTPRGNRTPNPLIKSQLLCRLS